MATKDVVLSRQFRAWDENFRKSPMWRKIVRQFPKNRVKDFRCFIGHLVECCGQCGVSCDDSILSSFEATYGEDPLPLIKHLVDEGFMKYDEPSGWIWLISGVWWQNASFNGDTSVWWYDPDAKGNKLKGGASSAIGAWKAMQRDVLMRDFPFKREFIERHYSRMRFDLACLLVEGFSGHLDKAMKVGAMSDYGPTPDEGGSDPGRRGVRPRTKGGPTPDEGGSDGYTRTGTGTETRTDRSLVDPRVAPPVPTERTPDEDGCPFKDVPHSAEDTHAQPEPDESTEAPREEQLAVRGGRPAVVGSPKAGGPTFRDSGTVREGHPASGMGSTRPPPPLVTLAEWQALPLDAKVKHVAYPAGCDAALRDHVQAFDDAAQSVYEHHARAVEGAGLMPRGDGLDAARRAVVFLAAEVPTPSTPAEAAERLMGLVDVAERKPEIVGRPLAGGVPAWVSPDVLFGASASATKFQPTAQRLPDNLNRAKAHAKADDRVRGARLRVVRDDGPTPPPPGWTVEECDAVDTYVVAKIGAKVRKEPFTPDPDLDAKEAALMAARAAVEGANAA